MFVDIEPQSFNIAPSAVAAAINSKTKAIIPVDLFGQMAAIEKVATVARGLPVIEDAAQTIGARRQIGGTWRMAGEAATMGTLSFFPSKNLGGYGDGGMIVTQDQALATRLRRLRVHGGAKQDFHDEVGYNSRLDTLQAAVLSAKLPHLAGWSAKRRENARYYSEALCGIDGVCVPSIDPKNESIFNQYTIRVKGRDALGEHLKARGIGWAVYYPIPLHLQECFASLGYRAGRPTVGWEAGLGLADVESSTRNGWGVRTDMGQSYRDGRAFTYGTAAEWSLLTKRLQDKGIEFKVVEAS